MDCIPSSHPGGKAARQRVLGGLGRYQCYKGDLERLERSISLQESQLIIEPLMFLSLLVPAPHV